MKTSFIRLWKYFKQLNHVNANAKYHKFRYFISQKVVSEETKTQVPALIKNIYKYMLQ